MISTCTLQSMKRIGKGASCWLTLLPLQRYGFVLNKQVDPRFLADAENLFIVQFKADTKHLNRYKALRFD